MAETARKEYQAPLDRINRATDREIDSAMAEILRKQAERPVGIKPGKRLKPARSEALEKERGDG